MKTIKEQADLIWLKHHRDDMSASKNAIYKHAIKSVEHTIEVLRECFNKQEGTKDIYPVANAILEQTELLTELTSRL